MPIKKLIIDRANRLYQMPPDILAFVQAERKTMLRRRPEPIDLATFDWPGAMPEGDDIPRDDLKVADQDRIEALKEEIAAWFEAVHHVKLQPDREIFVGPSISGIVHLLTMAYIDHGDVAFVPELGVPLYRQAITEYGGEAIGYTVSPSNEWLPRFDRVQSRLGRVARMLFLNSPHNPTGAVLEDQELSDLVWAAARENILVVNDAAYQGIAERTPPSLLTVENAKKIGVELYSLSYLLGLPQLPYGFAVGNRDIIHGLETAQRFRPMAIPRFVVDIASRALRQFPSPLLQGVRHRMRQSAAEAIKLIERLSLDKASYDSTPFIWARIERRFNAVSGARILYRRHRILTVPGTGFGESGQGYLRFSLTADRDQYAAAAERVKKKVNLFTTENEIEDEA